MTTHAWQTTDKTDRAAAVTAVLATGSSRGWTADEIAETLNLALAVPDVQRDLEGLVARALRAPRHRAGCPVYPPTPRRSTGRARGAACPCAALATLATLGEERRCDTACGAHEQWTARAE